MSRSASAQPLVDERMRIRPAFCFTGQDGYHQPTPYHPPERYPELDFLPGDLAPDNRIYSGMRDLLHAMGYDAGRFGTPEWSPLSDLVKPGGVVVIKPNFVRHYNEDPNGILSGEGNGPMGPTARPIGLLAAGEDPGSLDAVLAWIMGFDWRRIPVLVHATEELAGGVRISHFDGDAAGLLVQWVDERGSRELRFSEIDLNLGFLPHEGWLGTIEREEAGTQVRAS